VNSTDAAQTLLKRAALPGAVLAVGFIALYLVGRENYLLFHALTESFSLIVAAGIFIIAWNTRRLSANTYLLTLGVAHLFVAFVVLLHAFAYRGMGTFPQGGANLPTQLWIISRVLVALAFLVAGVSLRRNVPVIGTFVALGGLTTMALASIWVIPVFPIMYIDGVGLTTTKIVAEYVVMAMFAGAFVLLWRDQSRFEPRVARLLLAAIALMIAAELAFTLYVDVYGLLNLTGHYLVLVSFVLIYRALIHTVLREPYSLLFRELKSKQEAEQRIAETLQSAILSMPEHVAGVEIGHAHLSATSDGLVGGDFWDLFVPTPGLVAFVLGDICGKGIEAAASTVTVRTTIRSFSYEDPSPASVLSRANDALGKQLADDKFATVVYGVLDVQSGGITIARAGHPAPVLCASGAAACLDLPGNPPLGVMQEWVFECGAARVSAGDSLVLFSDGLLDAGRRTGAFGVDRMLGHVRRDVGRPPDAMASLLLEAALAHAEGTIDDDVAVVVLQFAP
jgi:hypothetical protein